MCSSKILSSVDLSIGGVRVVPGAPQRARWRVPCGVVSLTFSSLTSQRGVFVDFAVTLVLKCLTDEAALAKFLAAESAAAVGSTRIVSKFLNEQLRRVSCDIVL